MPDVAPSWSERAEAAHAAVVGRFGGRLLGIPFTHLARTSAPGGDAVEPFRVSAREEWHYWWQAHYLDGLVDAGFRHLRRGDVRAARRMARRGHRHLATMRLRNGLRFRNHFFDDMGWLALAVDRLAELDRRLNRRLSLASLRLPQRALARELAAAPAESGGVFWNKDRTFTNAATTAPLALHWARQGDLAGSGRLIGWVMERLVNPDTGLIADGIRHRDGDEHYESAAFTYNQGTTLAALLAVGEVERATALLAAIASHLTVPTAEGSVIRGQGGGDGGLFGGILARYVAEAARDPRLPEDARRVAARLVLDTAEALWAGRRPVLVFSSDPARPAAETQPDDRAVELSTQLQALLCFEAAARLDDRPDMGQRGP